MSPRGNRPTEDAPPGEVTGLGMKGLQIHLSMMAMRAGYDMIENRCNVCKENIRILEKVKYIERAARTKVDSGA